MNIERRNKYTKQSRRVKVILSYSYVLITQLF